MHRVVSVRPLSNYRLLLGFSNLENRVFEVAPYLDRGIFQELKDPALFASVRVSFDTIQWPNEADFCPDFLYEQSRRAEGEAGE